MIATHLTPAAAGVFSSYQDSGKLEMKEGRPEMRYEVKARIHEQFGPLYFYVHDTRETNPQIVARGTAAYRVEADAQAVADRLNAEAETSVPRYGRNGLTTY